MKKILGLILVFCLVFALTADALAAAPQFTQQPKTGTTNKKGSVSFSVKVKGTRISYAWYFIDPETEKQYTGKELIKAVKGVKVSGSNKAKVTLTKVPESMHGWTVYCHISSNAYTLDSERVQLLVYGKEPPEEGPVQPEGSKPEAGEDEGGEGAESGEDENTSRIISCNARALLQLDANGEPVEGEALSRYEFEGSASFLVTSEDPILNWTANGIRFVPAEPVYEFKITGLDKDLSLTLTVQRAATSGEGAQSGEMCKVVCRGCTFSYMDGGLMNQTEGEVPAGATISVVSDNPANADNGYSINGGAAEKQGVSTFRYVVNGDVEIVAQ